MAEQVVVFAGTRKGLFIFKSNAERQSWEVEGPQFPGWGVHDVTYDPRDGMLYAAFDHAVYGAIVQRSSDMGQNWEMAVGPRFGEDDENKVARVWCVQPGHADRLGVVWAGVDPGGLFKSEDSGKTWHEVRGINNHPTREKWSPGAGGMMVHTIVPDPTNADRMFVGISAAGVFRSDDGGETWQPKNDGVRADFLPDKYPEVGQCCHHLVLSPEDPNILFQQNHCGVYRSVDGGDHWDDIGSERLPATFGFPIAMHPRQERTIWVIPQVSDEFRYTPDGKLRVYRSRDGGEQWEPLTKGLPQEDAYLAIYREALHTDACDPAGVYFATTTGTAYYSRNEGDTWAVLSDTLPPVYSISTAVVQ